LTNYSYLCPKKYKYMKVAVVMGSKSDLPIMQDAIDVLKNFGITTVVDIVSAHRTPQKLMDFSTNAHKNGIQVIIAGAGGAAHLPGMVAAMSPLPVIGVPVKSSNSIDGWDSILSILQMPNGVPVATVALNAAKNAGLLAVQILASANAVLLQKMIDYKESLKQAVLTAAATLNDE
jgi:phosphoribosylaminoimidazole carboxylase, catalytic subunit